ncbi:hypothetical protein QYE76_011292 [Lolium multiflorum]|uniref:Reverse transcriptase/retrotransposon-derived protein RNase H-like domain-containing protein n=1 Tax=Lolium multiflorum TaxID=4521 RepID=A0AAD8X3W2_LOLMU|nr:hypothetical protein QYE76_011292 [Lolium multiflorum]
MLVQKGNMMDARDKLPPPPPLTGANAQPVFAQENRPQQQQEVQQVAYNNNQPPPPAPVGRNVYQDPDICCFVYVTEPTDKQRIYRRSMEVNAVMPAVPSRVKFSKVLIDNGSSINIMYRHTAITLGIKENMLQPTHTTLHGIVSGLSCSPLGKIRVDVSFGGRDNCRVENVLLEVVDLDSPYHALLGRSALAAFMATTRTAYLKMKMPAPSGPLTVVETTNLASLSRFISRLGEKALPLYALMRKSDTFVWTPQADAAFKELKNMLATAPILASPLERGPMLLYIAATNRVASVVVVVERDEEGKTVQRPVYYLSEVLSSSKQNYPHFQKMTYGVFMAATKLKHYFEEHPMKVVSEAPISEIMSNKDASGRIAKWAIQLSPYVPAYARRDAIKSQALADFLVDWAEMQYKPPKPERDYWKLHFDGSKLKEGLGAGVVLTSPKGDDTSPTNPSNEIFSESDEIKTQIPIFPEPSTQRRGPAPDDTLARGGAPPYGVAPLSALLRRLFAYIKPPSRKPYGVRRNPRNLPRAVIAKAKIWGQESLPAPCRAGKCPEGFSIDTAAISTAIFITAAAPMRRE